MEPIVNIYVASCAASRLHQLLDHSKGWLPPSFINKAYDYRQEADACRYLLGKLLLVKGMRCLGNNQWSIDQLEFDQYKKPYCDGDIHFNITHSGDYVLCAFSKAGSLGIDIEHIQEVSFEHFTACFTKAEWTSILNADNQQAAFFRYWTKKEAILKADGRGMHISLQSIEVITDSTLVNTTQWYTQELYIQEGYSAHIATSLKITDDANAIAYVLQAEENWL